jgi:hypothetical protein
MHSRWTFLKIEYLRKGSVKIDFPSEASCNNYMSIRYSAALLRFYDYRKNPKERSTQCRSASTRVLLCSANQPLVRYPQDIIGYYTVMDYKIFRKHFSLSAAEKNWRTNNSLRSVWSRRAPTHVWREINETISAGRKVPKFSESGEKREWKEREIEQIYFNVDRILQAFRNWL